MNTMQELLKEYKETRKKLKKAYADLRATETVLDDSERRYLSEMISDVEYVIEWLETGRRPESKRGIERRAAYQREKLVDPIRMQAFIANSTAGSPANISEWESLQIEDALCLLSVRERECYLLAHGEGFSYSQIAQMLNITVSSVETYIKRSQLKVSKRIMNSIFLAG
ncbi:hypothetical protein J5TS2_40720 [Brevibacillus halotolerans]|uniref:sigma factor-like helix-turn-helix DNA-binding protein n=1 Tax=Brevibacillus halotolerans TaxID=1507437 RepID=UPI001B1FD1AE|nr:sigma factor-like helix-turn-helix DNA-binding protein [Brevibacillus halotolerans]GIO03404.1 hypothetical protein J5TS2_40720 [Brevibacillus halotolerans]